VHRVSAALERAGVSCEVTWASGRGAFECALGGWAYDLVIADLALPGFPGEEALALALRLWPGIPFLFLGGRPSEPEILERLAQGATEVLGDADVGRLGHCVRRALRESRQVEELRRVRDEGRRNSALLRATLESTKEGILITDLAGKVGAYNRNFLALCGIPDPVMAPMSTDGLFPFLLEQFKDPGGLLNEARHLGARSEEKRVGLLESPAGQSLEAVERTFGVEDALEGRVLTVRDVTIRERAAEAFRQEAASEEKRRWQVLAAQAREAARRVEEPLNRIRNRLDLLEGSWPLSEAQRRHLAAAGSAAAGLGELLERITGGGVAPEPPAPLDVNGLLERLQPRAEASLPPGLSLRLHREGGLPCPRARPADLERAILALVANARDAMAGGGEILISTGACPGGVYLEVLDHGAGLAPRAVERMFEPFFTTKERAQGLGLFHARTLVERNGGTLLGETVEAGGALFRLELPVEDNL
jgi:signal transduction histidine kinase/CheY-like chemotaxis protein